MESTNSVKFLGFRVKEAALQLEKLQIFRFLEGIRFDSPELRLAAAIKRWLY
ncbi:MAG: hypothetical protein JO069_14110 [Verrucomicrobia bacterium]|nr:hypothetical protein [Verrucomicrobiota bacterium]